MKDDQQSPFDGAFIFQKFLDRACDKLEQKNAALMLIRLAELDSILSGIEKTLNTRLGLTAAAERPAD
jgi:hypothetical protein